MILITLTIIHFHDHPTTTSTRTRAVCIASSDSRPAALPRTIAVQHAEWVYAHFARANGELLVSRTTYMNMTVRSLVGDEHRGHAGLRQQ